VLGDTIVALASAAGPSERAVLRVSGPDALAAIARMFAPVPARVRAFVAGTVGVLGHRLPAHALVLVAPHSYTGEDTVELHVPGSPLLCVHLQRAITDGTVPGVRLALPGEFTRRAFEHGRLDLAQAEGVLALVHASDVLAAHAALQLLRGGASALAACVRKHLQDALAVLESGLDFTDGETGTVREAEWLPHLQTARAGLAEFQAQLPVVASGGQVLLLGATNAGKSSLCNALAGRQAVLVSATPGTTRDVVAVEVDDGLCLWDAPGDLADPGEVDRAALQLRDRLGAGAAAALLVVDPCAPVFPETDLSLLAVVFTKRDLGIAPPALPLALPRDLPAFSISARSGEELDALRAFLRARCRGGVQESGPGLRDAAAVCLAGVEHSLAASAAGAGHEVVAAELQAALRALDGLDGAHSTEDLLDRIFGRFCLGK
jgi:tRNA modification GTPase